MQNMHHFLQSELLSRRLAYYCCKRISSMFNEYSQSFFEKSIRQLKILHSSNKYNNETASLNNNNEITQSKDLISTAKLDANQTVNYILKKSTSVKSVIIFVYFYLNFFFKAALCNIKYS